MTVNILGTKYKIISKSYDEEPAFERRDIAGFCDGYEKEIIICKANTVPAFKDEDPKCLILYEAGLLRHEIVHAFLFESGLSQNSVDTDAWATNEEMVDWIARQGVKIYNAWQEAMCIR